MTDAERLQFIEQIAVYVQKYAPVYGILVHSPIIAQACLESAYGTSNKAQYHNYFGLKYRGDRVTCASGYFSDTSAEQNSDGSYTNITTDWYKFDSMESGVEGYFQFTNISNYDNLKGVTDPRTYLENIKSDGYATSIDYVDNVMAVIEKWNLTQYDTPIEQRGIKVAIDAGHGSDTAGKRHPDGYREHWSDTYMAFYLNQILVKNGFETFKTSWDDDNPTDDEDVALATRQAQIKAFGADISVSIHANAYGDGASYNSAEGVSTHYHSNTSRVGDSVALATCIQNELIKNTTQKNRGIVAQELAMCNCVAMGTQASVLMETAFMTNSRESALLQSDEFCMECAREIAQGIFNYFEITDADANVYVVAADRSNTDTVEIDISTATVTLDHPVVEYYGDVNCPAPTVVCNGVTLSLNTHYIIEYSNNINAGIAIAKIIGMGIYYGTKDVEFTIEPRDISTGSWVYTTDSDNCINLDELGITCIGFNLEKDTDYTLDVSYSDYNGYKLAICNAYGIGNYDGVLNGGFFVEKYDIELIDINTINFSISSTEFTYNGSSHKPIITNTSGLIENTDYTVNYNGNFINAGSAEVVVTGIGSYTGTITYTVTIKQKTISLTDFSLSGTNFYYTGSALKPTVSSSTMTQNTDYSVEYSGDTINVGEYQVIVTGIGNYTGSVSYNVIIIPKDINQVNFSYLTKLTYTGSELNPSITCKEKLVLGTDYTVEYSGDRVNVGTFTTTITGIGNYTNTIVFNTVIGAKSITSTDFNVYPTLFTYNGDIQEPSITTNLRLGIDYTMSYPEDMINVGNKEIVFTGINNYTGTTTVKINITACNINNLHFSIDTETAEYYGGTLFPTVSNSNGLAEGIDYTVKYEGEFVNVGQYKVIVTGIGNYTGIIEYTMTITKNNISDSTVTVEKNSEGYYSLDTMVVSDDYRILKKDTDYTMTVDYIRNTADMTISANVLISGINNYTGTISKSYIVDNIDYIDINNCLIDIDEINIEYSGVEKKPKITVVYGSTELIENTDYTLEYKDNINAGTGKIIITGIGLYINSRTELFTIQRQNISTKILYISRNNYDYTGNEIRPAVSINGLTQNVDYIVEYSDNKYPGTAKVTAEGIGNYIGITSTTFVIIGVSIKTCIAEYGTPSIYTEYRVDGEFKLYADEDSYKSGKAMTINKDYTIVERNVVQYIEFDLVYIIAKGENKYTDQQEFSFKVIYEDVPPSGAAEDDGTYNFGYLDISGSETAVGDYDFGCLDCGTDPGTSAIDGQDYDFNVFADDTEFTVNTGDIYTLKNTKIYYSYHSNEIAFKYTGNIYIYDSRIINNRVKIARIEDAVDSPARVFGWLHITDLLSLDKLPIGEKVVVTGRLYANPDGTGSYILKEEATMYVREYADSIDINTYDYPYLLSNSKKSSGIGYAARQDIIVFEESV